jgi:DNA-binding NarL/FixJ family response regulator
MQPLYVVLLQSDARVAQSIVSALANTFSSVRQVQSLGELRTSIARHRAGIAILDMETASISDVKHLSREFPTACIVCTHRLADEDMWTAAVNAGAADVCPSSDTGGILRTALRNTSATHSAAA